MNTIGIALVWCVVQVTLIGLAAAGLCVLVRRLRPAAAAPVVLTGLMTVVILSLLALSPWPRWTIHSPAQIPSAAQSPDPPTIALEAADTSPLPLAGEGPGVRADGTETASSTPKPPIPRLLWQTLVDELSIQPAVSEGTWRWPAVVAVLLLAAMAVGLAWLVLGVAAVRWQQRCSHPVPDRDVLEMVDVLCAELGCRRTIEVRQSNDLVTAATIGWRRPVVLLPADWTTWTADQRRAVLAHEIAHARSHDFLALLFGQLALVLHFYHPLLHWLMNRLRLEQELAADAAAASVSGGQRQYLATIAELALRQADRPLLWPARTFLPTRTTFLRRIAMLRDSKLPTDRLSPAARVAMVGLVLLCGLLVAGLRGPARQSQALAGETAVTASKILDDVVAAYRSMETYQAEGTITMDVDTGSAQTHIETSFSMALKKPNMYLISWTQTTSGMPPGMTRSGTVWSDGTQPYLYMGVLHAYSKMTSDQIALGAATGISGGAAHTMPSLFFPAFNQGASFARLKDPRVDASERVGGEDCYVVSGSSVVSNKETFWISKAKHLIVKYSRSLSRPEGDGFKMPKITEEQLEEAVRSMGMEATEENKKNVREMMACGKEVSETVKMLGSVTEVYAKISSPALSKEDFRFTPPEGTVFKESLFGGAFGAAAGANRETTSRIESTNNMKWLALAMHNYYDKYKLFPLAVLYGPDGKTPHSWRVAVLPFLDQKSLYAEYHFDQPWDSPENRKVLEKMPAVYRCPTEPAGSTNACYFALVGPGTMFDGKTATTFQDVADGTAITILLVEAERDIPWTKPEDIPYDPDGPLPALGGFFEDGFHVALVDGEGPFLSNTVSEEVLRALITKAGGERVDRGEVFPPQR